MPLQSGAEVQRPWIAVLAWLVLSCVPAGASERDPAHDFDIEPQSLDSALIEFSEQSGVQLMVATELVTDLESPGVRGHFTTEQALLQLIGTNKLTFQRVGDHTIAVSRADDEPRAEPAAQAAGGTAVAAADTPASGAAAPARPAQAFSAHLGDPTEEIVVTGVRGKPRSVAHSPAPIDVITSVALERTGRAGVFEAIQYLVPSFHLPARAGGSTSTVIATGGLRGLNPDQTLVLVNGKRRHTTSLINAVASLYNGSVPADLDHIPVSAVKRIEILRDGAAAQYGSDAIAGVINIILKDAAEGGSLRLTSGQNVDRGDGESLQASANLGLALGESGFLNLSAAWKDEEGSNRARPIDPDVPLYYPLPDGSPDPREATIDRLVTRNYGSFPSDALTLGYNAGLPLANGTELYSFGTWSRRDSILNWSYREPNDPANIDSVYPDGFRPRLLIDEEDVEVAFGARGEWGAWRWDATTLYGQNVAERYASQTINASLGPASPTEFYVGRLESADWVNTIDFTRALKVGAGELQVSWGGQHHREFYAIGAGDPASYAAGDFVFPDGHPRAGEQPPPAAQANHGITPDDASDEERDSVALYGELGWSPTDDLFLGGAVRYENYDDAAGDTVVGKLNGRYAFSERVAVRATASTGFRAPPLAQQQYASSTSQFRDLDGDGELELLLIKQLPPESPAAVALGAVPLVPEESTNLSLGLTFEPAESLIVTVDAYRIELDDRISITSTLSGPEVSAILVANGLSSSLSGQYYTNAIDTTTTGLDIVATYVIDMASAGLLSLNLGYNRNETEIDRIAPNPPHLESLGPDYVLFDRTRQGNLTYAFPEDKTVLGINWAFDNLSVDARAVRFGAYRTTNNNADAELDVAAETIVDLDLSYRFTDLVTATIGASNVFNTYPPEIRAPSTIRGSGQYDTSGGYGFTGGSYYARVELRFR